VSFQAGPGFGADLAYLLELVGTGRLRVDVGWRGSWSRFDEAVAELLRAPVRGQSGAGSRLSAVYAVWVKTDFKTLTLTVEDGVAELRLNRPTRPTR